MGTVAANTRENWNKYTGTTHLAGDLASSTANRGDIALIQVSSNKISGPYVYADPGSSSGRTVKEWWSTWSEEGQLFCTDGITTREMCNWQVYDVGIDVVYHNPDGNTPTFRGGNIAIKYGQCTKPGDSGGPLYTIRSDGGVAAKGIHSGGAGGGSDDYGGLYDPCFEFYTDIRDPWLGLPGTIKLG